MSKYIDNIEDCTLLIFRKVISKQDYKLLLVDGSYNADEGKKAWEKLFDEYRDSVKSGSVNYQFESQKLIEAKKNDYNIIQNCLHFISIYSEINIIGNMVKEITGEGEDFNGLDIDGVIKELNKHNFKFDKKKGIAKEIERVKKQSVNILNKIQANIEKLQERKDDTYTFDDTISVVSKFMGYRIPDNDSVKMFVSNLNMLINHNKQTKENGQ